MNDLEFDWIWNKSALDARDSIAILEGLLKDTGKKWRSTSYSDEKKAVKEVLSARTKALSHAIVVLYAEMRDAQFRVAKECAPWFDDSAFDRTTKYVRGFPEMRFGCRE